MRPLVGTWLRRLSYLLRLSRHDAELREEIEAHRSLRQAHLEREGLTESEADSASRRALGNVLLVGEEAREVWLGSWDTWWQDIRYGLRMLRRSRGVATLVILTMAVGIGMNAAMFGIFHAVLIRPLPYPDPERLLWMTPHHQRFDIDTFISRGDFVVWRDRAKFFERMTAYGQVDVAFLASGQASEERITSISEDFWAITGAKAALGRLFGAGERNAMVLSHRTFERRFNAEPSAIGRTVSLNGYPVSIVGVLPRNYRVAFPPMLGDDMEAAGYISLPDTPSRPGSSDRALPDNRPVAAWVRVVGKLRPRVTIEQARSELQSVFDQIGREFPTPLREERVLRVVPLQQKVVGSVQVALTILLVAVAFVLMIATINIAHLLLARSLSRQTEIAVRMSLGAGRTRIVRQLLSEGVLLTIAGCGAGLVLANWALQAIVRLWPQAIPRLEGAVVNTPVLVFTLVAALVSTVSFSVAPAASLLKTDLAGTLKREDRAGSSTPGVTRIRGLLVSFEVALATALLIGAGLTLKSYWLMSSAPRGVDPEHILVTRVSLSGPRYASRVPQQQYVDDLLSRLEGLTGTVVGIDAGSFHFPVKVDGVSPDGSEAAVAAIKPISLGFLHVMGVPLIRGRWPTDTALKSDAVESTDALLVNQRFVDVMMRGQEPIGRHVSGPALSGTIAGVVADFKDVQLDAQPAPQVYVPFKRAMLLRSVRVLVRTDRDPSAAAPVVREAIAQIDRSQAIAEFTTLDEVLTSSVANRRFNLSMLCLFAAVALFLSLTGAYGVIAHSVAQRRRDIGIRIALGARPTEVVRLVAQHEMRFAFAGVALGLLGAFTLTPVMANLLYDVAPRDPATFAAVGVALATASLLTSWTAAAKAASVDPVMALRH
jgi:putative ABC transport system permease protein